MSCNAVGFNPVSETGVIWETPQHFFAEQTLFSRCILCLPNSYQIKWPIYSFMPKSCLYFILVLLENVKGILSTSQE